jgi:hypothetical protein
MGVSGAFLFSAAPLLALAVLAPVEEGKIYECTDSKGEIVYQGEPCPEVAPAPKALATPKPRPAKPPAKPHSQKPPPSRGTADSRWATPEKTLKTFVGAVTAGDRALILGCLTSGALADLGPDEQAIPLEKLKEMVNSFTAYVTEGDLGPFWSVRAKRSGQRPKWIFLERTETGEWKIASI